MILLLVGHHADLLGRDMLERERLVLHVHERQERVVVHERGITAPAAPVVRVVVVAVQAAVLLELAVAAVVAVGALHALCLVVAVSENAPTHVLRGVIVVVVVVVGFTVSGCDGNV